MTLLLPPVEGRPAPSIVSAFVRRSRLWWGRLRWWVAGLMLALVLGLAVVNANQALAPASGFLSDVYTVVYGVNSFRSASVFEVFRILRDGLQTPDLSTSLLVLPIVLSLAGMLLPAAVIALAGRQINRETHDGLSTWQLARPVSPTLMQLAALLADALGIFVTLLLPSIIAILLASTNTAIGFAFRRDGLVTAFVWLFVLLIFWYALAAAFAIGFRQRRWAIGIPLLILLLGNLAVLIIILNAPAFGRAIWPLMPWSSAAFLGAMANDRFALGNDTVVPMLSTLVWTVALFCICRLLVRRRNR
jgi:ABC-type transport system involved in multi-copper enzyme maturation permease subunit